jgi:hypothetical protein
VQISTKVNTWQLFSFSFRILDLGAESGQEESPGICNAGEKLCLRFSLK